MARVALALEGVGGRRIEQRPGLGIAQRRRLALAGGLDRRALHTADRVVGDGVALAQVIEERGQRRELAPDAGGREAAFLERMPPGDDMGPGDGAHVAGPGNPEEGAELVHVTAVGPPGALGADVGEPLGLRRHRREIPEPVRGQGCRRPGRRVLKGGNVRHEARSHALSHSPLITCFIGRK